MPITADFFLGLDYTLVDEFTRDIFNAVNFPRNAVWKNSEYDIPVIILGVIGRYNNVVYYKIKDSSTGIPASELVFK